MAVCIFAIENPRHADYPEAFLSYRLFDTAERTLQGVEAMHMMRKGQVKRFDGRDALGQLKFVFRLFQAAA